MSKRLIHLFAGLLILCHSPFAAQALETPWSGADYLRAQLISGADTIGVEKEFEALFEVELSEGWHTYWRVPGDAGLPPRFDWSGSENIEAVDVSWPAPHRFQELDFYTFGYEGEIGFPLRVVVKEAGKAVQMKLKADIMVCNEICIPQTVNLALEIPAGNVAISTAQKRIDRAREKLPVAGQTETLRIDTAVAGPDGLALSVFSQNGFADFDVIPTIEARALSAPPQILPDEKDKRRAMVKILVPGDIPNLSAFLNGKSLKIVVRSGAEAIEKTIDF